VAGGVLKGTILDPLLTPIVRPATRYAVRFLAVPVLRAMRRRIPGMEALDRELEKDIEEWFRGSLLLLAATKNFELWVGHLLETRWGDHFDITEQNWFITACRLLLAIAVIEAMPDQELFQIIHGGPPRLERDRSRTWWQDVRAQAWPVLKGVAAQHLSRSSAVFAIIAVILGQTVGWACYGLAVVQYLVIGLITSRDKALGVLAEFDRQMARKREELIEEFQIDETRAEAPFDPTKIPAQEAPQMRAEAEE
jgi:hypothetical protein